MKGELLYLRKQVWPIREVISRVTREELPFIHPKTGVFFQGCLRPHHSDYRHHRIIPGRFIRDAGVVLSILSTRTNEVMKVLTMIATIFIPITFIAGIYGMNFKFMPELDWRWGYAAVWGLIVLIVLLLLVFFKHKKWI